MNLHRVSKKELARLETIATSELEHAEEWVSSERLSHILYPGKQATNSFAPSRVSTRQIVMDINRSDYPHIVISEKGKGYKIATSKEEAISFLARRRKVALRMLKGYYKMLKKVNNDGQLHINADNELEQIETLLKGRIEEDE